MAGTLKVGGVTLATHSDATGLISIDNSIIVPSDLNIDNALANATFPALGELYLYDDGGSPITFVLNSTDSFVIFVWAYNTLDQRMANEYGTLVAGTFTEVLGFTGTIAWSWSDPNLTITVGSGYSARIAQVFRVG